MSEAEQQVLLISYCNQAGKAKDTPLRRLPMIFHIPNGGLRSPREAAKLKRMGVKSGVSDLFLPAPVTWYNGVELHGFFLEMKFGQGSLSENQIEFLARMEAEGYGTGTAFGASEGLALLMKYLLIDDSIVYQADTEKLKKAHESLKKAKVTTAVLNTMKRVIAEYESSSA